MRTTSQAPPWLGTTFRAAAAPVAPFALAVPNLPAFAGLTFHHQMLVGEVDGGGALALVVASNARLLTIGTL